MKDTAVVFEVEIPYPSIRLARNPKGPVLQLWKPVKEAQQELQCIFSSPLISDCSVFRPIAV